MTVQTGMKISVMFAVFIFVSFADVSINQTFAQSCGADVDAQIVESIYAKMAKDSKLAGQVSHINVTSTNRVVKLRGWVENESNFDSLNNIALKTDCVIMVNSNDLAKEKPSEELMELPGMCSGETKPCGDICIPVGESCNIKGD